MKSTDKKMLELIELLKARGDIRFDVNFCDEIGLLKQNLVNIKNGINHFTTDHIKLAVRKFNINANWIFDVSDKPFRNKRIANRIEKP